MKGPGLFSMLQIAAGLSMAGGLFVIGFEFVRTGQTLPGIGFFVLGVLVTIFPTYLVRRIGGPRAWIKRRLAKRRSSADGGSGSDGENSSSILRNPFRRGTSSDEGSTEIRVTDGPVNDNSESDGCPEDDRDEDDQSRPDRSRGSGVFSRFGKR